MVYHLKSQAKDREITSPVKNGSKIFKKIKEKNIGYIELGNDTLYKRQAKFKNDFYVVILHNIDFLEKKIPLLDNTEIYNSYSEKVYFGTNYVYLEYWKVSHENAYFEYTIFDGQNKKLKIMVGL